MSPRERGKRWDSEEGERVAAPDVDAFLDEVIALCKKHNMSIGHQDDHGAFIVHREYSEEMIAWLDAASVSDKALVR